MDGKRDEQHRAIRSFVLRQGRISHAQRRALDELLSRHGVPFQNAPLDLARLFGRNAPKILEIGFGMGEATAAIAQAHPENDYLGLEVHTPGVGALLKRIAELGLSNVRLIQHDAVEVLQHMIAPATLGGVHIFFPDPWPKKRHHKRRLIQAPLLALLVSRMKPGATLHLATDWEDYALQMLEVLRAEPALRNENAEDGFSKCPDARPETKFEARGLRLGHRVWDLVFTKV